jgi:hypothetical protein
MLQIRGSGSASTTTALRVENSNASASLVVLDNGNVGIGNTSPSERLHVSGNILQNGTTNTTNTITTTGGYSAFVLNRSDIANQIYSLRLDANGFYIERGIGNADIILDNNRRVGIGTTSVSSKLQVRGSGATSSTTALRVENNNISASLVVLDNGFVGLGTNTPTSLLQIGSGSGFLGDLTTPAITFNNLNNGIYLDSNRINFKAGGGFSFGADSNGPLGNGFRINSNNFNNLTTPIFVASRLSLGINSGYGGNNDGHLSLITSGSSRIYIDYSGSVGIGKTTPNTTLDVSGSVTITGSLNVSSGSISINGSNIYESMIAFSIALG